jgi:peptidoglycan hydrolase-like protein with peptidoglycan-binding domain
MKYREIVLENFEITAPQGQIANGQKGSWVANIQTALIAMNYSVGNFGPKKDGVDGIMGPLTIGALRKFAADQELGDESEISLNEIVLVLDDVVRETGLDKQLKSQDSFDNVTSQNNVTSQDAGGSVGKVSPKEIYNYIRQIGLSKFHAMGMLANIQAESSFNPGVMGDKMNGEYTSGGLFQHHKTRLANLKAFAERRGTEWTDWKTQVDFALTEPAGKQYASMDFKSAADASIWFTKYFEIPANKEQQAANRVGNLKNYDYA